jgi:Tfp pilus assembly protein PilF
MLERAVGLDPSYAPAWAALGMRYYFDATYSTGGEPMFQRSNTAYERAVALDPNLIFPAGQLITNRVERGDLGRAYEAGQALVKRRPENGQAHFALAYVLRYAGLLEEASHECDTALALDPGNYGFRSCALVFSEMGKPERAEDFIRLDAGSEWSANSTVHTLLRESKLAEAREKVQKMSNNPYYHRDLLEACLQPRPPSDLDRIAHETESALLHEPDPEPSYFQATTMAFCGQKEIGARLLKSAIERNYCAYAALQSDPLLAKLRGTPEFSQLLSAAKECQEKFLAERK